MLQRALQLPWLRNRLLDLRWSRVYRLHERWMDFYLGVETKKCEKPENFGIDPSECFAYVPADWWGLSLQLRKIPIRAGEVFCELGCGKGRVLLWASRKAFGRIVGIELIPELANQARKNLRSTEAEIITGDASKVAIPDDVTFFYAFQPFPLHIFLTVVERMRAQALKSNTPVRFLYNSPVYHEYLEGTAGLTDLSHLYLTERAQNEFRFYEISPHVE